MRAREKYGAALDEYRAKADPKCKGDADSPDCKAKAAAAQVSSANQGGAGGDAASETE